MYWLQFCCLAVKFRLVCYFGGSCDAENYLTEMLVTHDDDDMYLSPLFFSLSGLSLEDEC